MKKIILVDMIMVKDKLEKIILTPIWSPTIADLSQIFKNNYCFLIEISIKQNELYRFCLLWLISGWILADKKVRCWKTLSNHAFRFMTLSKTILTLKVSKYSNLVAVQVVEKKHHSWRHLITDKEVQWKRLGSILTVLCLQKWRYLQ